MRKSHSSPSEQTFGELKVEPWRRPLYVLELRIPLARLVVPAHKRVHSLATSMEEVAALGGQRRQPLGGGKGRQGGFKRG